jgi:hypothetical protein
VATAAPDPPGPRAGPGDPARPDLPGGIPGPRASVEADPVPAWAAALLTAALWALALAGTYLYWRHSYWPG